MNHLLIKRLSPIHHLLIKRLSPIHHLLNPLAQSKVLPIFDFNHSQVQQQKEHNAELSNGRLKIDLRSTE